MEHSTRAVNKYRVPRDNDGDFVEVEIHVPRLRAENLSLQTWGSSYILASQLHTINVDPSTFGQHGVQILELGAGTGLVGLSAAAIWKANVVLTDLEPIIPALARNIEANQDVLATNSASVICGELDWNQPQNVSIMYQGQGERCKTLTSTTDKATVILAADTVYSEEHPRLLSQTILAWLKPEGSSRAIITYALRVAYLDAIRELWERLEAGGLYALDEGKAETGDEWDDERWYEWSVWTWRDK